MGDEIEYRLIKDPGSELLNDAAALHIAHLGYRSFITMFGQRFMVELYKDMLQENAAFFVFALLKDKVAGFVLACGDSSMIFSSIKKKTFKYAGLILPRLLVKPLLIPKLFETFFYVKKENTDIKAELVVIVTDSNYRSAGVGSRLVEEMNAEFIRRGINKYKVTVHDEMERSNRFYVRTGMTLLNSFMMYKVKWNLYVKDLTQ